MALIIEDGSGVANANSYISVQEAKDYAALRGLTLPSTDPEIEILAIKAFDYLEALDYKGVPANPPQATEFPRADLYIQGILFANDEIPHKLKKAQSQLTFEATNSDLQPTGDGREVVREKVDVIEVQYAEKGTSVSRPTFTAVNSLLKDLVKSGAYASGTGSLSSLRV